MHKAELISALEAFVQEYDLKVASRESGGVGWKGQKSFAQFLIEYFKRLHIPSDEKYDFWRIDDYLPELLVDAFEQLRTSKDEWVVHYREIYEADAEHEVPNITDLGESNILHQGSAVRTTLGFMFKEITGQDWLENAIDKYCNAQQYVLQQTFDKFLRRVYRQGMFEMADQCAKNGMSGKFGETELRTFITAGRIMFTFARKLDKSKPGVYKEGDRLFSNEDDVSFVAEDGDPLALSAGIQSVHADFRTALDMIEDVINGWPDEENKRAKVYSADKKVSII